MSTEQSKIRPKHPPLMDLYDLNQLNGGSPQTQENSQDSDSNDGLDEDQAPQGASIVRKFDEQGNFRKAVPINLQGLSSLLLPPITKKKVAIYEVIGKDEIDPLTGKTIDPTPLILPGSFVIQDIFEQDPLKRFKMLKYVTRSERVMINNQMVLKEYVEDIVFSNGFLSVPVEKNYLLYTLLELHPLNETNKYRDKTSENTPAFRRTDMDRKTWAKSLAAMDLAFDAEKAVVGLRKPEEIIAIATALGVHTSNRVIDGEGGVKYDLRIFARNNPIDFFKVVKNTEASVKLNVIDSINIGLVEYNMEQRSWHFSTDGAKIGTHLAGEDPQAGLIKLFLKEEYQDKYKVLLNQLNYWD